MLGLIGQTEAFEKTTSRQSIDVKYVDPKNKKRKKAFFMKKNKIRKMKNVSSKLFTPIEKQHQDNTVTPLNYCNLLN